MLTKIIVITPVKNEEWILDKFLAVTSSIADHIIIADQNSTDNSKVICTKYPKVVLIENNSSTFNEADRQILLIESARKLFPDVKRILLALDADELIAANATDTKEWKQMLDAEPGTVLHFEKPTFYDGTEKVIRYPGAGSPLGYIDDGAAHSPSKMHSVRIPGNDQSPKLFFEEIKILHYGLARLDALQSKLRYYSCLECILKGGNPLRRRISYPEHLDFSNQGSSVEVVHSEWLLNWEKTGINLKSFAKEDYYWYDKEILQFFEKYGTHKFYNEDIWYIDWEKASKGIFINRSQQKTLITSPSKIRILLLKVTTTIFRTLIQIKRKVT